MGHPILWKSLDDSLIDTGDFKNVISVSLHDNVQLFRNLLAIQQKCRIFATNL